MVRSRKQNSSNSKCGVCECITKEEGGDVDDYFGGLCENQSTPVRLPSNSAN